MPVQHKNDGVSRSGSLLGRGRIPQLIPIEQARQKVVRRALAPMASDIILDVPVVDITHADVSGRGRLRLLHAAVDALLCVQPGRPMMSAYVSKSH